jgi:hypothetical protein
VTDDLTPEFYTTERLNTESPAEQKIDLPPPLRVLEGGFPKDQTVTFCSKPHYDPMLNWIAVMRRIAEQGSPVIVPLEDLPSTRHEVLRGRPLDKIGRFVVDYSAGARIFTPLELSPTDWEPPSIQAVGRVGRRVNSNAGLPKRTSSRNQREGVYGFKVDGRHTRKKTKPKVEVVALDSASAASKIRASKLANVDQKQHAEP